MTRAISEWPIYTWWSAGFELWQLGIDAGAVMTMRTARIAQGGTAGATEASLMITEKMEAAFEAQLGLMTGRFGMSPDDARRKLVRHYGAKVRANRKRLGKG